jgi:molybdate transport system ATP-binding protein
VTTSAAGVRVHVRFPLARFDVDFALATDARSIGLFGASGAGKSSVLEAVAGWRAVREGTVELAGRTLLDSRRGLDVKVAARGIGYVPQDTLLFPHWSVEQNIRSGAPRAMTRSGSPRLMTGSGSPRVTTRNGASESAASRVEIDRAIEVLELGPLLARSTTSLSGGERQRVALARALCSAPRYLLLDEPLGALDLPLRRKILPYLIRVRETFDLPMLFVSHDATEVQALCDEVAVMREGRVIETGPASRVLGRPAHRARELDNVLRGVVVATSGGTARVELAPGVQFIVPAKGLRAGERALFSLGADEILLSLAPIAGISARNVLAARVERVSVDGDDALVETVLGAPSTQTGDSPPLVRVSVNVTRASATELALAPNTRVHLVFKTQSVRVLSSTASASG